MTTNSKVTGKTIKAPEVYESMATLVKGQSVFYPNVRPTDLVRLHHVMYRLGGRVRMVYSEADVLTGKPGTRAHVVVTPDKKAVASARSRYPESYLKKMGRK